jgi:hypothetical protein
MAKRVGTIEIAIDAGTAQFLVEMDKANVKLQQFGKGGVDAGNQLKLVGKGAQEAGHATVTGMQAASSAIREAFGGANIRAVERFLTTIPGVSQALKVAFPLVGGLALGQLLVDMGEKAVEFFKKMEDGPRRLAAAFRTLNAPLQLANDEMALANDRLSNEIAKLEGRHENTLKIALDEAKVAADKLAESLDKDLDALGKLLKEENLGFFKSLLTGQRSTSGDEEGIARFRAQLADVFREGNAKIRSASTVEQKDAAEAERNIAIQRTYNGELERRNKILAEAERLQAMHEGKNQAPTYQQYVQNPGKYAPYGAQATTPDQSAFIREQKGVIDQLQGEYDKVGLMTANEKLTGRKAGLEASKASIEAETKALEAGYDRMLADAETFETLLASDKLAFRQNELQEISQYGNQYKELRLKLQKEIGTLTQEDFKAGEAAREKDLKEEKSYQEELSHIKVEWMKRSYDAIAAGTKSLSDNRLFEPKPELKQAEIIPLQQQLAGTALGLAIAANRAGYKTAQTQQADIDTDKQKLELLQKTNSTLGQRLELQEKILNAEIVLGIQQRQNVTAQIAALGQLQIQLDNIKKTSEGWAPFFTRMLAEAKTAREIEQDAVHSSIDSVSANLAKFGTGDKTNFKKDFHDIGQQMAQSGIKSTLEHGLGKLGGNLMPKPQQHVIVDNFPGGQNGENFDKTPLGGFWRKLSGHSSGDSTKLIYGLPGIKPGTLSHLGGVNETDGPEKVGYQSESQMPYTPGIWHKILNYFKDTLQGALNGRSSSSYDSSESSGGNGNPQGSGVDSSGGADYSSDGYGGEMAAGGNVDPGHVYMVGEKGPEMFRPPSAGSIVPNHKLGGTHYSNYNIDARGADLGASNRIARAIEAAHSSAIAGGAHASAERARRTPQRS